MTDILDKNVKYLLRNPDPNRFQDAISYLNEQQEVIHKIAEQYVEWRFRAEEAEVALKKAKEEIEILEALRDRDRKLYLDREKTS